MEISRKSLAFYVLSQVFILSIGLLNIVEAKYLMEPVIPFSDYYAEVKNNYAQSMSSDELVEAFIRVHRSDYSSLGNVYSSHRNFVALVSSVIFLQLIFLILIHHQHPSPEKE